MPERSLISLDCLEINVNRRVYIPDLAWQSIISYETVLTLFLNQF